MQVTTLRPSGCRCLVLAFTLCAGQAASLPAQTLVPTPEPETGTAIRWWHGALAVGGVSALMLLVNSVRGFSQDVRGTTGDGIASTFRHMGQPEIYATVPLGLLAAGLVTGDSRLTRAGRRVATSVALTGAMVYTGKYMAGRPRPDEPGHDGDDFFLLSGREAMPSGHTAISFALATSLADEIRRPWATVGLYTAATAVGWSRINDNRHWASDVAMGALIGITSAKFASGRWTILGLRAPSLLTGPGGIGLGWQAEF